METILGRTVVLVPDHDVALSFYGDLLGFEVIFDRTAGGYRYLHVGPPAQAGVGLWLMAPVDAVQRDRVGSQTGEGPFLVVYVSDLAGFERECARRDIETWNRSDDEDSRSVHLRDPFGNVLIAAELI